jgi:RNA-directed DNA polymerase
MNLESDKRLNIQLRLDFSSVPTGEARQAGWEDIESLSTMSEPERPANTSRIMEEICERANLKEALRQVRGNKGSAGVDRMTVDQLGDYLKQHWLAIREQMLNGTYEPKPVRRVEIPKPDGGGVRKLGIPTVLDRFIQQAGRFCRGNGIRHSPNTAMGSDRVGRRITPWLKRSSISRKATDG